jgi:type II secretory pathway pseudopilin PulG
MSLRPHIPVEAPRQAERGDEGFMMIVAIIMIFLVLLTLSVAAPRIAKQIQHDREQESARRAGQYVRAVRIFYQKFHRYPTAIEQLEKTNNQRFLRQRYVDPLTGKDNWRIIHQGENQTQVKGFFGEDLPGLPGGLGAAAGMASSIGTTTGGSAFNNGGSGSLGGSSIGSPIGGSAGGATTGGGLGQTGSGTTTGGSTTGSSTSGSSGIASQDATTFTGSGGGPIIGIGSSKTGEAMLVVNEQNTYETWEFLYDPRIEQLYAKATLLGGISSGPGTSGGFGTPINSTLPPPPAGFGGTTPTPPAMPTPAAPPPQ